MNNKANVIEIIVDRSRNGRFIAGFGAGDGSGRIDKRQGRGRRFGNPVAAMDTAELWAKGLRELLSRYPEEQRLVRVLVSPAVWTALEEERRRLDTELILQKSSIR